MFNAQEVANQFSLSKLKELHKGWSKWLVKSNYSIGLVQQTHLEAIASIALLEEAIRIKGQS